MVASRSPAIIFDRFVMIVLAFRSNEFRRVNRAALRAAIKSSVAIDIDRFSEHHRFSDSPAGHLPARAPTFRTAPKKVIFFLLRGM
jgi:hypothetical protein